MLPSIKRLTRLTFPSVLSDTSLMVVYNRLGTLKYISSGSRKYAVITSSKHEKTAVGRNKMRRRIYTLMADFPGTAILYVSKQSYGMEYTQIKNLWYDLITKTQKSTK